MGRSSTYWCRSAAVVRARGPFFAHALNSAITPVELTTDRTPTYPWVLGQLVATPYAGRGRHPASALLQEAGLSLRHEVNATTLAQIEEELARTMGSSQLVPIYVISHPRTASEVVGDG